MAELIYAGYGDTSLVLCAAVGKVLEAGHEDRH
jgi:hypothetical protein